MNENLPEKPKSESFEFVYFSGHGYFPERRSEISNGYVLWIKENGEIINTAINILKSGDDTLLAKSTQESISNSSTRTEEEIQVLYPQPLQTIEPQSYEVWASKWISYPVILLLSKEMREEWLGDLYEKNQGMLEKGYPLWHINLMNLLWSIFLIMSALKIKISDVISLPKFKQD